MMVLVAVVPAFLSYRLPGDSRLQEALHRFAEGYRALGVAEVRFDYRERLAAARVSGNGEEQLQFFRQALEDASSFSQASLSPLALRRWHQWRYEILRNLQRIDLEARFRASGKASISDKGIWHQPLGKEWYRYLLRFYLDSAQTPEKLKAMGLAQVADVEKRIKAWQQAMGFSDESMEAYLAADSFVLKDRQEVVQGYAAKYRRVMKELPKLFRQSNIAALQFAPIGDADGNSPPGMYQPYNTTFYFNFLHSRHHRKDMDYLLLHEGVPGHHYQNQHAKPLASKNPLNGLFWYGAYIEGWGAYAETLGDALGMFDTPEGRIGWLQWDLVRSVRVVLDIGLNDEGWPREKALAFWKAHIRGQDAIADREISRMLRWPAQVITYKFGEAAILGMRRQASGRPDFDIRDFHERILEEGPLPLSLLQAKIVGG